MKKVLVDSSVWINYFKGSKDASVLDELIDLNQICINDLILAELIPFLRIKRQKELIELLQSINSIPIDIDWKEVMKFQETNLMKGINKVGIPDLIIAQNARDNGLSLLSFDRHFELMSKHLELKIFGKGKEG